MSLDRLIESRIQDAAAAGAFDNLGGAGKPFRFNATEALAGANWMGYKLLENGGMLPPWLLLAREIEDDRRRLDAMADRFGEWVALAEGSGAWERHAPTIRRLRARFAEAGRSLRRKQDRFNIDAPSMALERPAVWVEYLESKLDDRLRAAGAPPALFPWLAQDDASPAPAAG